MQFYPTFDSDSIRSFMPAHPVLLPASSWSRQPRRADGSLAVPHIPGQVPEIAVDSGGYAATLRAEKLGLENGYTYLPAQYVTWLQALGPRLSWAATFDFVCAGVEDQRVVRERQARTTEMAWLYWSRYQRAAVWVPTIQGQSIADYRRHAQELRPLIDQMARRYGETSAWRVGIGGLVRREVEMICQICTAVAEELPGIPLHAWGVSLRMFRSPLAFPRQIISCDSSSWNSRFCRAIEECRASGLRQREWTITRALPRYLRACAEAQAEPKQLLLPLTAWYRKKGERLWLSNAARCGLRLTSCSSTRTPLARNSMRSSRTRSRYGPRQWLACGVSWPKASKQSSRRSRMPLNEVGTAMSERRASHANVSGDHRSGGDCLSLLP